MKAVDVALAVKGATFVNPSSTKRGGEQGVPHESSQEPFGVARERKIEEEDHEAQRGP